MSKTGEAEDMFRLLDVIPHFLAVGCPCRFPRYVYLVGFNFEDYKSGPVCFQATQGLVESSAIISHSAFLNPSSDWRSDCESQCRDYRCRICSAEWELVTTDYSIDMYRSYLRLRSQTGSDLGAEVVLPFPLCGKIFAFKHNDIDKCTKNFKRTSVDESVSYLIKTGFSRSARSPCPE
jgi:hypothetical protein